MIAIMKGKQIIFLFLCLFLFSLLINSSLGGIFTKAVMKYYSLRYEPRDLEKFCRDWHSTDPGTAHLQLPECPPTAVAAQNSLDYERDGSLANTDFFHASADFCIRNKKANKLGGRQQCCYNKNGEILLEPPGGGTEDSSDNILGHFWNDIRPWYFCCQGQIEAEKSTELCLLYYAKRPSNNGSEYFTKANS